MEERLFGRSSKLCKHYTNLENLTYYEDIKNYYLDKSRNTRVLLLDSSLISQTFLKKYNIKVVECGSYKYVYKFDNTKVRQNNNYEKIKNEINIDMLYLKANKELETNEIIKNKKINKEIELKEIELKNINRSRIQLQMLVKTNEEKFKTFITLTFKDEIKTIKEANKQFNIFKTYTKRKYNDFSYVCVPEFQKNGRVHYHLLTNILYDDIDLINENYYELKLFNRLKQTRIKLYSNNYYSSIGNNINDFKICYRKIFNQLQNTKKTYNHKSNQSKVFKTLKYWNYGYSNVVSIDNINIVAYLTKYLTKDIDTRLFGSHRYMYSQNLSKPSTTYLDLSDNKDFLKYLFMSVNNNELYSNSYIDRFGNNIDFVEYKLNENLEVLNV